MFQRSLLVQLSSSGQMLTNVSEELPASIITAMMMQAVISFETLVSIYQISQLSIPDDSHLQVSKS
jgi:hypothetical protein